MASTAEGTHRAPIQPWKPQSETVSSLERIINYSCFYLHHFIGIPVIWMWPFPGCRVCGGADCHSLEESTTIPQSPQAHRCGVGVPFEALGRPAVAALSKSNPSSPKRLPPANLLTRGTGQVHGVHLGKAGSQLTKLSSSDTAGHRMRELRQPIWAAGLSASCDHCIPQPWAQASPAAWSKPSEPC